MSGDDKDDVERDARSILGPLMGRPFDYIAIVAGKLIEFAQGTIGGTGAFIVRMRGRPNRVDEIAAQLRDSPELCKKSRRILAEHFGVSERTIYNALQKLDCK